MSEIIEDLNQNEAQCTKDFIERVSQLSQRQLDGGGPNIEPLAWNTAVKFLMARKFDVKRAVDLYISHQSTRRKEGISEVDPRDEGVRRELLTEKFTILPSRDNNGAAIALFTARLHFPPHTTHQAVLQALVFQLDTALESLETQRNGLVFVYDMTHSKYTNFDYELSIKILSMLKGSYPARLKKVLIVTAPLWFKAPFKIIRLFVREKLRDRVYTANILQLPVHIPLASLPQRFGGKMEASHRDWINKCLSRVWGKGPETDSEISAYLEGMHTLPSMSSLASNTTNNTGGTTSGDSTISDIESDGSVGRGDKRNSQDSTPVHKGGQFRFDNKDMAMDTSDDFSCSTPSSPMSPTDHPNSLLGKRGADSDITKGSGNNPSATLPNKKRPTSSESAAMEQSIHGPETGGFTIKELVDYCKIKGRKGLYRQYAQIKGEPPSGTFEISKAKSNLPKNRYTDVLCLDHSRVKLSPPEGSTCDYINANYVDGYRQKSAYISTQGPLPKTFGDFWRLIWEQMVLLVVMTTRTVERGRLKCGQYWPLEEEAMEQYGNDFVVINNGVDSRDDYTVTSLILQNLQTQESREITHFQFTSWPDYGVPHSASAFLDFMFHVREEQKSRTQEVTGSKWTGHPLGPPIVIHCSAGIGRTGTFITMDICTRRLADIGTVEIQKTVRRIRSQRAFSIQMPDQYVFCHLALMEHAQREGLLAQVDLEGFDDSSSEDE